MDPIHLRPAELDYELDIRGVYNLSTTRQKTTCLREYLRREEMGERTISAARVEQFNPETELSTCSNILDGILIIMQDSNFEAAVRQDCRSRLLHVISRIKRAKPASPESQTLVYQMIMAAESKLTEYNQALAESVTRQSNPSATTTHGGSPLADVIETIRAVQISRQSEDYQNITIGDRQGSSSSGQRSNLNPTVQSFVPDDRGARANGSYRTSSGDGHPSTIGRQGSQATLADVRSCQSEQSRAVDSVSANGGAAVSHSNSRDLQIGSGEALGRQEYFPLHDVRNSEDRHEPQQRYFGRVNVRSVPVHKWKLSYSGDGNGLHLYDFLAELRMFQRSEGVSDAELFSSVVHLLTGRARLWYRSWFDTFHNWNEMVVAMKAEFLPPKYDYKMLTSIANRRQKSTETFAEYFNTMQSMFRHLAIPIEDMHKLSIIEENMLTKYAMATSVVEITSLEQLSNICRRVDFAQARNQSVSLDRPPDRSNPFRERQGRYRDVNELGQEEPIPENESNTVEYGRGECSGHCQRQSSNERYPVEVLEIRSKENPNTRKLNETDQRECFNCLKVGHTFSVCPLPRNGQFCYRCGSREVLAFKCKKCTKNTQVGSTGREGAPGPRK